MHIINKKANNCYIMPIIESHKWYNSNKLAIARYQEQRLYEPDIDCDDDFIQMIDDYYQLTSTIVSNKGDIVTLTNNISCDKTNNIDINKYNDKIWFSLPTEKDQQSYKNKYKRRYIHIFKNMVKYKLRKTNDGEDEALDNPELVVNTIRMSKLDAERAHKMSLMYLIMIKEGKLWLEFHDHINAQVFYRRKNTLEPLVPENSRCLADCDNLLKIVCRYIKYNILDEVFVQNTVNTNINRARKCFIKYYDDNYGSAIRKLCFESVGNIGSVLHKTDHPYMLLDLSNAYNNVLFPFLKTVLNEYLPNPSTIHPDIHNGNFNQFYDIHNETELNNICNSIEHLLRAIRYHDHGLGIEIRRNKGVPQGSALSIDLFIICMDYILKKCIMEIKELVDLKYNKDYKLITYVDDILILLKTEKAYKVSADILHIMSTVFNNYHFKMNQKKSKASSILVDKYGCNVKKVEPNDKYLGIYLERDLSKYLKLVEQEISKRYHFSPHMKSFDAMEKAIPQLKTHERARIRGKLQYVLIPFASTQETRGTIMLNMGYPGIASLFKDESIDLSVISPQLDFDQNINKHASTTYKKRNV